MFTYVVRRALYVIPLVFGVTLITFLLFHVVGGDPVMMMAGKYATPETMAQLRKELGLDRSLVQQYLYYLKQIVTLDFGRSFSTKQKISTMLMDGILPSLMLSIPAFIFTIIVSTSISLFCAFYRGTWIDRIIVFGSVLGMCISMLAYIIAGQYFLAYKFGLFPIHGFELGINGVKYLVLPWIIWLITGLGYQVRFYRTVILDETNQDYVRTAWAKGLSRNTILFKHILKNSMIPILTNVIIELPFLYTGSLLLESFFGIPGLGNMAVKAIQESDFPVIKFVVFIGSVLFIVANLMSDIAYSLVDPRVELK